MNHQNEESDLSESQRELESKLRLVEPVESRGESDAQLMYAMGHASGLAEGSRLRAQPTTSASTNASTNPSTGVWKLATALSLMMALGFALLAFAKPAPSAPERSIALSTNATIPTEDTSEADSEPDQRVIGDKSDTSNQVVDPLNVADAERLQQPTDPGIRDAGPRVQSNSFSGLSSMLALPTNSLIGRRYRFVAQAASSTSMDQSFERYEAYKSKPSIETQALDSTNSFHLMKKLIVRESF